ncbi:hypothetical protein, conserved [Babesia ovata]|uniref:Uncharacterized protein n=1 Tax=Babesia ovata TaxID=189622 RepID=A0A2H6KBK3_9APIC|nr:uncharacterized protein BOVATA_018650 [Babesia ovata]GBE60372.1 hypothetical protein, conserved [Babesia ovata]
MALRGKDAGKNLAAMGDALHKFLADKPVGKMELPALENVKRISKEFLEQKEFRRYPFVQKMLGMFNGTMNKKCYKYLSSKATWEASCSKKPEACAAVLAGIAPMLFGGLRTLRRASTEALASWVNINAKERLRDVLKAVGYEEPGCRAGMSGSDIRKALSAVDIRILDTIYDLAGFWAFY